MGEACPLCGREIKKRRKPLLLYGHNVCKKCFYGLANRRQLAFFLDWIGFQVLSVVVGLFLGIVMISAGSGEENLDRAGTLVSWAMIPVFLCKDGFGGVSPGKAILGLRVVDVMTGEPVGFGASLKRNLPLLIPFMPLIVACTLSKGERIGDGWANSKVVRTKHAESPVFATGGLAAALVVASNAVPITETIVEDGNPYRPPLG